MDLRRDVPLADLTTLGLGGPAEYFVDARTTREVLEAIAWADERGAPLTILGGGSNALVPDDGIAGLVLRLGDESRQVDRRADGVWVTVGAGADWAEFVDWTVDADLAGVECLAGIPGRVGATPIQNVGAYGQEVCETIARVSVYDRRTKTVVELDDDACGFRYRDSTFKRNPGSAVVLDVTFRLRPGGAPARRYAELERRTSADAGLRQVRDAVVEARREKSMVIDPQDPESRSAGSFFLNPIVSTDQAADVDARAAELGLPSPPRWPYEDRVKFAAAWLIEKAGFPRGTRRGAVGQSAKHALALVHRGGGTMHALLAFAEEIAAAVRARFGVELHREPRLLGVE